MFVCTFPPMTLAVAESEDTVSSVVTSSLSQFSVVGQFEIMVETQTSLVDFF